jgi:hypothetical protein
MGHGDGNRTWPERCVARGLYYYLNMLLTPHYLAKIKDVNCECFVALAGEIK